MTQKISHPILIATRNSHKIREIKEILSQIFSCDLLTLFDFPDYTPPEEDVTSFKENAIKKAIFAAKDLHVWALADDSGLVVPALQGKPGVISARFAGENASDAENRKKLLLKMSHLKGHQRDAYFECCMAIASPNGLKKCACATCEGTILSEEKGGGGFGYDPLFVKHDYNKTFSEIPDSIKNKISHRRKALDKLFLSLDFLSEP